MFCHRCGHRNPDRSAFCSSCGAELEFETTDDTTASFVPIDEEGAPKVATADDVPADAALLVIQRGPGAGSRYMLDQDIVRLGRHPDADILLDDVTVSRKHAEIHRAAGEFVVRDVGSLNGTYLNRNRVEESELRHGDELQIGKFRLVFYGEGETG